MPTPLAFRAMTRSLTNSPLAGTGYSWLTLSGTEVRCRALTNSYEVERKAGDRTAVLDVQRWVQFDERHLAEAGVDAVVEGDLFRDGDGVTWQMVNALRKANGSIKARLQKPQRADPLNPLLNPQDEG